MNPYIDPEPETPTAGDDDATRAAIGAHVSGHAHYTAADIPSSIFEKKPGDRPEEPAPVRPSDLPPELQTILARAKRG